MSTNIDSAAWMTKGCQEFFSALRYKVTLNSPQLVSVAVLAPARDQGQLLDAAYNATQALFGELRGAGFYLSITRQFPHVCSPHYIVLPSV